MATLKDFEEAMARRSTAQGVVTRHANSIRKLLSEANTTAKEECKVLLEKLHEAKARFDEAQVRVEQLAEALSQDVTEVIATAGRIDKEVLDIQSQGKIWTSESTAESAGRVGDVMDSEGLQFASPSKGELKAKLHEICKKHDEEKSGMLSLIKQLQDEMQQMKTNVMSSTLSTPASHVRRGVSFHDVSGIQGGGDSEGRYQPERAHIDRGGRYGDCHQGHAGGLGGRIGNYRGSGSTRTLYPGSYADDNRGSWERPYQVDNETIAMHQRMLDQSLQQHKSASMKTPSIKLGQFSGEPLEYVAFFNNFDELVDAGEDNDRVKLSLLQTHCSDKAGQAIAGCGNFSAREGYVRARRILKHKFGSEYVITQAWMRKLLAYPALKSAEDLESFALDLASCKDSLYSMGYQTELRSSHTLSLIVSKLPFHLRNKWRRIHREHIGGSDKDMVCELVSLVQEAADEVTDPVFSETAISRVRATYEGGNPSANRNRGNPPSRRFGVNVAECEWNEDLGDCASPIEGYEEMFFARRERSTCAGCSSNQHFTSRCRRFKELNPRDRLEFVKAKNLCIVCLSGDHVTDKCNLPWRCQDKTCGKRHHTALHGAFSTEQQQVNLLEGDDGETELDEIGQAASYVTEHTPCLPITPVLLRNGPFTALTYCLLDTGSTITMFNSRLVKRLNLKIHRRVKFDVNTVNSMAEVRGGLADFEISKPNREKFHPVFSAMAVDKLPLTTDHIARAEKLKKWPHLKDLKLCTAKPNTVDILIGQDNAHLLEQCAKIKGKGEYDPYAVETPLGWTIFGTLDGAPNWDGKASAYMTYMSKRRMEIKPNVLFTEKQDEGTTGGQPASGSELLGNKGNEALEGSLGRFWSLDKVPEKVLKSKEDKYVLDLWNRECQLKDGHVVLPIPYKTDPPCPPNNLNMAIQALKSQGRHLNRHPKEKKQYITSMRKNFTNGHAEVVPENEISKALYTWYLLHHGVDHPRKPDVTRVVKHGSAKFRGVSLNDLTYTGPDLMNKLLAVLIRFRQRKEAGTGDVENMFNMVRVFGPHKDSLRFVWWKDDVIGGDIIICRMTTHIFGTGWAPAAAMFALRKLAEWHSELFPPCIIRSVLDDFYVDDWLHSAHSSTELSDTRQGVCDLLDKGTFKLCKFASNSRDVLGRIEPERRAKELAKIDLSKCESLPEECTLGACWSPEKDMFFFKANPEPRPVTRRGLTSSVASIYDPMGMLTPFIVPAKLLMQKTCRAGASWDCTLEDTIAVQWGRWLRDLDRLDGIDVPRWLGCTPDSVNTLHHFGDASEKSYGGASYLVVEKEKKEETRSSLVMSKSRLAPLKTQSIPRLEMCAAVIATKLDLALREYLSVPLQPSIFWSDSTIVLFLLMMDPGRLKTFMENRVSFVQDNTEAIQWYHVPSKLNPADLLSRGLQMSELVGNSLWFQGPDFLRDSRENWPKQPSKKLEGNKIESEVKKDKPVYTMTWVEVKEEIQLCCEDSEEIISQVESELVSQGEYILHASVELSVKPVNQTLVGYTKAFSSLWKSIRGVAWLKRLWRWHKHGVLPDMLIPLPELRRAEESYVYLNQKLYLTKEQIRSKSFRKLFPMDDNGVLRVGGRLDMACISWGKKHPYVVPENSPMAVQVLRQAHIEVAHAGSDRVVAESRNRYWVIGAIKIANSIKNKCVVCVRLRGQPLEQIMAPVPESRLQFHQPPFTCTGVDMFGPLMVVVKRSLDKRYGVLFTCMTSRAIHLELALDLSLSAFMDSLDRFVARRGRPRKMYSDNGTNFVASRTTIYKCQDKLREEDVHNALVRRDIEWSMNSPSASHQGGCWERMIREVRKVIMAVTKGVNLSENQLTTVLCRAENIVNSRPLTRLCDGDTSVEPLTPNHLLTARAPELVIPEDFDADKYREAWKNVQSLARSFWRRWMLFYIPEMQKRSKWTVERESLQVGELVILVQDQYPRFTWPLGIVKEVFPGTDGRVRNVVVRTAKGELRRPVQKLLRLEMDNG